MKRAGKSDEIKHPGGLKLRKRANLKKPCISIVIGIRDWGIDRLEKALISHKETYQDDVEVVVSDFGSVDPAPIKRLCRRLSCRYVYTESGVWSRSRALNVGLSAARSDFLVTTDSDILFSPTTLPLVLERLKESPNSIQLVQCRDLSEGVDLALLTWDQIHETSTLRPRWGMGGLAGFTRDTFDAIRGFDERMEVWGAEDRDFVKRAQAFGSPVVWIDDPAASIFHLWHPPFLQTSKDAQSVFQRNHAFLKEDHSIVRNWTGATYGRFGKPVVSVVIATFNRADRLGQAITSCLNQTVEDIEVIVWDDGSTDATQDILAEIDDSRLKVFRSDVNCGLPATRNKANAAARGTYIAIHDDDDLMMPDRLASQLAVLDHTNQGSYGGWIDRDEESGEAQYNPGASALSFAGLLFNARMLLHPTVLVRSDIMRAYRYEESFRAGSDYNLLIRMVRDGVTLAHCGKYLILRAIHDSNMTKGNAGVQKSSARVTHSAVLNAIGAHSEKVMREAAKKTVPYPIPAEPALSDIQAMLSTRTQEFYAYPGPVAGELESVVEELAFEEGAVRQVSAYAVQAGANATMAGRLSPDAPPHFSARASREPSSGEMAELIAMSAEEGIAVELLRPTAGQVLRCQLNGDGESVVTHLSSLAVRGEPLYLVRLRGAPTAVFFACRTNDEADIRMRKALRIPEISRVDALSS
ncbi:MAG: kfoC [Microvirga sp.]|jgi:glycosyltransferase involved in cell wall biosynthesis|nr:kfoC [Microvirga sp.]